jgi:hypothetical protein
MPYSPELSGDSTFWEITKDKSILPYLIDRISDTTQTNAPVPYFGGNYTIGDVCVTAIETLIRELPTVKLITNNEQLIDEKGYGVYWEYVRSSVSNRNEFKNRLRSWYKKNKDELVWVADDNLYPTADSESAPVKKLPAGGFYVIKSKKTTP